VGETEVRDHVWKKKKKKGVDELRRVERRSLFIFSPRERGRGERSFPLQGGKKEGIRAAGTTVEKKKKGQSSLPPTSGGACSDLICFNL